MSDEVKPNKAIFYTDGGFEINHKVGGWGIHGYRYIEEAPKKGTGNPKAIPTTMGYAKSKEDAELVTLTHYISGVGYVDKAKSSNHTELHAVNVALNYIQTNEIKDAVIYSDSENTVKGFNQRIQNWRVNGWKNRNGDEIENVELWKTTDQLLELLRQSEYNIKLFHIDGHAGLFGNEQADDWARKGNALGIRASTYTDIFESEAQGFWKPDYTPSKLLGSGRWYFSTNDRDFKTDDGMTIYYMGDNGGEDELMGKPMAENGQSIVFLKEPDPVLEQIREETMALDVKRVGRLIIGRLDSICSSKIYDELRKFGTKFLKPKKGRLDLVHSKKRPVLVEKTPVGQGFNAIDHLHYLERYLRAFQAKDKGIIVTEIGDVLYDKEAKKDKVVCKLSGKIGVTTKALDLKIRYCLKPVTQLTGPDDPDIKEVTAKLIVGRDLPRRSTLSDIADKDPKVYVVTWRVSDQVIRFATIVECDDGYGIWSATDSNMLYIKQSK